MYIGVCVNQGFIVIGVASRVAVRARAQLLKEADSRSNRVGSRRGAVWSARATRARSAFWALDFGDAEAVAAGRASTEASHESHPDSGL